jgi:hypothetical protein
MGGPHQRDAWRSLGVTRAMVGAVPAALRAAHSRSTWPMAPGSSSLQGGRGWRGREGGG